MGPLTLKRVSTRYTPVTLSVICDHNTPIALSGFWHAIAVPVGRHPCSLSLFLGGWSTLEFQMENIAHMHAHMRRRLDGVLA